MLSGSSSKKLLTPERSTVATNLWFPNEYFLGAAAKGASKLWNYQVGIFSSSGANEFGKLDSGYFTLTSLGYDFSTISRFDSAKVRLDYVYNNPDYSGNVGTRDLSHILSLSSSLQHQKTGIRSGVTFGDGIEGQSDLFGLEVMPTYDLSDKWQFVCRYSYVYSPDDNGVRLNRYESKIISGRSNEAHEGFVGINTYFYGHKLKWQNGVEYINTKDRANDGGKYNGWGVTSAFRMYF